MNFTTLGTAIALSFTMSLVGCKEEQAEVPNPDCADPAQAGHSKCIRSESNIIRSEPKTWSLGSSEK